MKNKPSLLILTTSFPLNSSSSAGVFVLNEALRLKDYFDIKLICPHHAKAKHKESIRGISVRRFTYFIPKSFQRVAYGDGIPTNLSKSMLAFIQLPFFLVSFLFSVVKLIKKEDTIYVHWFIAGLIGVLIKKIWGNRLVLMMHHAHRPNPLYRWILKNVDYVIANSDYVKEKTFKISPIINIQTLGVPIDEIYINHTPSNKEAELKKKIGFRSTDFVIICIGRMIELKGHRYLIKAFSSIVKDHKDVKLLMIGKGPLKEELKEYIRDNSLLNEVVFFDFVQNKELPAFYSMSDVCVIPSVIDENGETEGLGITALESMSCGTPVIASNVGGLPDNVIHEYNGLMVPQKDPDALAKSILKIKNDFPLLRRLKANSLDFVSKKCEPKIRVEKLASILTPKTSNR